MAKLTGASRIFATDRLDHRLAYAQRCGATDVLISDGNEAESILAKTKGRGLDVVFEAAGDDGAGVETGIESAKRGCDSRTGWHPLKRRDHFLPPQPQDAAA